MLSRIRLLCSAMLLIWSNFFKGPRGAGRPRGALYGIMCLAMFHTLYMIRGGAEFDREIGTANFYWIAPAIAFFAWAFLLPPAIYLIDYCRFRRN